MAIAERHRHALETAARELEGCEAASPETAAECVRWAVRAVDELIGNVANEDVLDEVYNSFCIGK